MGHARRPALLHYTIAAVAGLTVQDPFVRPRFPSLKRGKKKPQQQQQPGEESKADAEARAIAARKGVLNGHDDGDSDDSDVGFDGDHEAETQEEAAGVCARAEGVIALCNDGADARCTFRDGAAAQDRRGCTRGTWAVARPCE